MEKMRSNPCTITIPTSKTCTTGTRSQSLWVSVIKDDTAAGVLREGTVSDNMSRVIAESRLSVWTIVGGVTEASAKRTVVMKTTILRVTWGMLLAIGTFIVGAVDTKMPCGVAVKTYSLWSHCH